MGREYIKMWAIMKKMDQKRKGEFSWYIKLNIMIMSFLFVLFLIKQVNTSSFRTGLNNIFSHTSPQQTERSVRIQINSKKNKKKPF